MRKKIIDTRAYVSALRELTEAGKEVGMRIEGNSMAPFLVHERDFIYFRKPDRELRRGDMVFYQRRNGQFVMHRICAVTPEGYCMVGDGQTVREHGIAREQIFGLIVRVKRKEKILQPGSFCWEFFSRIWIRMIPLRPAAHKLYRLLCGH